MWPPVSRRRDIQVARQRASGQLGLHAAGETPRDAFDSRFKAHPPATIPATHFRVRHDKVDKHGSITIRYQSKLHHIGMGARHRGQQVVMLIADRDIRIISPEGETLRHLTLDPTRDYKPQHRD